MPTPLSPALDILERASPGSTLDRPVITEDILDLLGAIGLITDKNDEDQLAFRAAAIVTRGKDIYPGLLATVASAGRLLAELQNTAITDQLNMEAARQRPRGSLPTETSLVAVKSYTRELIGQIENLRQMAQILAEKQSQQVHLGTYSKIPYGTALFELADFWLCHTGSDKGRLDLPYSESSQFIKFCVAVLGPFVPQTECTAKALSRRWLRLKKPMAGCQAPKRRPFYRPLWGRSSFWLA